MVRDEKQVDKSTSKGSCDCDEMVMVICEFMSSCRAWQQLFRKVVVTRVGANCMPLAAYF